MKQPDVKFIKQTAELDHIYRCARICYGKEDLTGSRDAEVFCSEKWSQGHKSVFRHASRYYAVPVNDLYETGNNIARKLVSVLKSTPYADMAICHDEKVMYVSANLQWLWDHKAYSDFLEPYMLCNSSALRQHHNWRVRLLVRYTVFIETQASTSRELNRKSPNNITERSTRYVKPGSGLDAICEPHWFNNLCVWKKALAKLMFWIEVKFYDIAYRVLGLQIQDAREYLPLATSTRVAYTYTLRDWLHIIALRYYGSAGKPHPNCKIVMKPIVDYFESIGADTKRYC